MVQIIEIYSYTINESTIHFTLILWNPIIHDFKNVNIICQIREPTVKTSLIDKNIGKAKEYDESDKNWIPIPDQLKEGSHMLIEETIEVDLSDDLANLDVVQLGK